MSTACSICTEEIERYDTSNYVLPCAHVFHPACITEWLNASSVCPICKHPVNIYTTEQLERYHQRREAFNPEHMSDQSREFVSTFINEYIYNIRRDVNIINIDIDNINNQPAAILPDEPPISSYYIESKNNSIENESQNNINARENEPLPLEGSENAPEINRQNEEPLLPEVSQDGPEINDQDDEPPPLEGPFEDNIGINGDILHVLSSNNNAMLDAPSNMPERNDPYLHVPELMLPEPLEPNEHNQNEFNVQVSRVLNYIYQELSDNNQLNDSRRLLLQEIMYIFDRY